MITKDMIIEDVIRTYPATIAVFRQFGLECMGCQIASYENLEGGAGVHKVDVEALLKELNRVAGF